MLRDLKFKPVYVMTDVDKAVSLVKCDSYDREEVMDAVRASIDLIGGIGRFVSPGQKVLLKPNLLQGSDPQKSVTTHPEVVYAVAKILRGHGCTVTICDSPGAGIIYNEANMKSVYSRCGMEKIAEEAGAALNYDTTFRDVPYHDGRFVKRFSIISPALDADAIVVVSKAKTHMWTYLTAACKNLFGLIPGLEKTAFHARFQDESNFGRVLVDLNEMMKPRLQIMDAVTGMEGDGPTSGSPRKIGAIMASPDYTAMDVAVCRLMSLEPMDVGTIRAAAEMGLVKSDFSDVSMVGDPVDELIVRDFKKPSTYLGGGRGLKRNAILKITQKLGRIYALRPRVLSDKCIGCRKCERSCPVRAITMKDGKPVIDLRSCIRCYCCHEMCMERAIALERSRTGKIMGRIMDMRRKK